MALPIYMGICQWYVRGLVLSVPSFIKTVKFPPCTYKIHNSVQGIYKSVHNVYVPSSVLCLGSETVQKTTPGHWGEKIPTSMHTQYSMSTHYVCVCSPQDFRKVEGLIKALHNGLTHEPATCTHPSLQKTSCETSQYTYVQSYWTSLV